MPSDYQRIGHGPPQLVKVESAHKQTNKTLVQHINTKPTNTNNKHRGKHCTNTAVQTGRCAHRRCGNRFRQSARGKRPTRSGGCLEIALCLGLQQPPALGCGSQDHRHWFTLVSLTMAASDSSLSSCGSIITSLPLTATTQIDQSADHGKIHPTPPTSRFDGRRHHSRHFQDGVTGS